MNFNDTAGVDLWQRELRSRRASGGDLYFHRPRDKLLLGWRRAGFLEELGAGHLFQSKRRAIEAITADLDLRICAGCPVRLFTECERLAKGPSKEQRDLAPSSTEPSEPLSLPGSRTDPSHAAA